jgi:hypothetical protein
MNWLSDPNCIPLLVLLLWPLSRAIVFVGAAIVCILSRKSARRAEARRVLRMLSRERSLPRN